jgi:hypothetical protein
VNNADYEFDNFGPFAASIDATLSPGIRTMTLTTINLIPRIGTESKADREALLTGQHRKRFALCSRNAVCSFSASLPSMMRRRLRLQNRSATCSRRASTTSMNIKLDKNESPAAETGVMHGVLAYAFDGGRMLSRMTLVVEEALV